MKIGIIGAGNIAGTMATTLQQMKGTECYAIASRDIKRATEFADKYGFERAYGSYADMLNDMLNWYISQRRILIITSISRCA